MTENRLINEKSPYLLQHAHNPVDWYPWGRKAFERARLMDRPIFLSIGYSTCHWCHVMERESFEDARVAALLNRLCVAVKVDREERPDVDAVYMAACQAFTGSGGWPLTILMTPDQKPFWAGTYLPKQSRWGQPGLLELLEEVESLWDTQRDQLLQAGDQITAHISGPESPSAAPEKDLLREAFTQFQRSFDVKNGGFGQAPKFPTPHNLLFLMAYARMEHNADASRMAETTLTQMARGGLFDQIGGGFSRYSTDERWLAPHFEKMLYDNALLSYTYLESYERTGQKFFQTVARRTISYVLRELTGPRGEFYCGQDADSQGVEGKYYLLTPRELHEVLGPKDGARFCSWYDISDRGNFEGKNIPNLLGNEEFAREHPDLSALRKKVRDYRRDRVPLHRDDKVLTAWNALMIAALAKASRTLGKAEYLHAANRAWKFLREELTAPDGRLMLRWREGEAAHAGQLDDYAFCAWASLELYAATFEVDFLEEAARLARIIKRRFWDKGQGGFFLTADDAEKLIIRPKEAYDGALPSGNSVAGWVFSRLWELTGEPDWEETADRQLAFLTGNARQYPAGHAFALLALREALDPSRELVCATADGIPEGLIKLAERHELRAVVKTPENAKRLADAAPYTAAYPVPASKAAFYLCRQGACASPVFSLEALEKLL